jgi:hypothetical protein
LTGFFLLGSPLLDLLLRALLPFQSLHSADSDLRKISSVFGRVTRDYTN